MDSKEIINKRIDDLLKVEVVFSFLFNSFVGKHDYNKDFYVPTIDIECSNEKEWQKIIDELTTTLAKRKIEKETKETLNA